MSMAKIFCHPNMTAEQTINLCRREGLEMVHNPVTGNFRLQEKLQEARERFGRPFAHQPGTDWKPRQTPVLVEWLQSRGKDGANG